MENSLYNNIDIVRKNLLNYKIICIKNSYKNE